MTARALVLALIVLLPPVSAGSAATTTVVGLPAAQDVSLPFWCDWGYDWDERCYRDDGDRLPIGGDEDKLWRAALRFSTSSIPAGAVVVQARLHLFHDGRCLGPRKTLRTCEPRAYELQAHPILGPDWFREREVDVGPVFAVAELESAATTQWISLDLTNLVAEWVSGAMRNDGVLVRLADGYEQYGASGPRPASSTFHDPALRPRLEITYIPPAS